LTCAKKNYSVFTPPPLITTVVLMNEWAGCTTYHSSSQYTHKHTHTQSFFFFSSFVHIIIEL
jgi:hypothetical protein